jgi:ribosomal protein S27E
MKPTPVSCQKCGASLEIFEHAGVVTCRSCHNRVSVQTGTPDAARIQTEIENLDRAWAAEMERNALRSNDGSISATSPLARILFMVLGLAFGFLYASSLADSITVGGCAGVLWIFFGLYGIGRAIRQTTSFRQARTVYQSRRHALETGLGLGS